MKPSLIQRLRNLWHLSEFGAVYSVPDDLKQMDYIHINPATKEEIIAARFDGAQIIYPNKREELLKSKPEISLDELLSE